MVFNELGFLLPILLPLSLGFAMLRYRLWEIGMLINRRWSMSCSRSSWSRSTPAWSLACRHSCAPLSSRTAASPSWFQRWLSPPSSTLRQRLQILIDHRFYRSKYDAQKTLATFRSTLHAEMDLSRLSEQLIAVVDETMRPASASLWLFRPQPITDIGQSALAWAEEQSPP